MLENIRTALHREDDGASAVEYGLLVAAIAALVVLVVFALGGYVKEAFDDTCATIKTNSTTGQDARSQPDLLVRSAVAEGRVGLLSGLRHVWCHPFGCGPLGVGQPGRSLGPAGGFPPPQSDSIMVFTGAQGGIRVPGSG